MKLKLYLFLIFVIWSLWLAFIFSIVGEKVNKDMIITKNGLALNAYCIKSRSILGINFKVNYDDENSIRDDYISLPIDTDCNKELLDKFKMKRIKILAYKNHYLGLVADGFTIKSVDHSIREYDSKNSVIYFTLFVAIIFSLALLMKIRALLRG